MPDDQPDAEPADGGLQSMDQMANWVRFADTKATILTAGVGVALTMLMTNAKTIATAVKHGWPEAAIVGGLAVLTLVAFSYTLYWLVRAIGPRNKVTYNTINRFAWPTLLNVTTDELTEHTRNVDVRTDAWQQVIDLSALANRKFEACGKAVKGFAALVLLGVACVAIAIALTI
ncbi:hypothetical protein [Kribbella steppae]|uniref:hypothetical protein n=1 Tax=Kribbella steppae TaxID=2512223 RepID=UPI0010533992|nr:hypothetical protein [Kribbella steppae]